VQNRLAKGSLTSGRSFYDMYHCDVKCEIADRLFPADPGGNVKA
jgi:hypothetical protein